LGKRNKYASRDKNNFKNNFKNDRGYEEKNRWSKIDSRRTTVEAQTEGQAVYLETIRAANITFGIGPAGSGKCLGKGTKILMFDGSIKNVEDVIVGDKLMGPDSTPRKVLSLARGREQLYKVIPVKGDSYIVNESHILSLKISSNISKEFHSGKIWNVSVKDFLESPKTYQKEAKGYRVGIEFDYKDVPIDPYILGIWLGDGTKNKPWITTMDEEIVEAMDTYCSSHNHKVIKSEYGISNSGKADTYRMVSEDNSFVKEAKSLGIYTTKQYVPQIYKINSRNIRLQILAGLLDSDGDLTGNCFNFVNKNEQLADDVLFIARSLGLAAYKSKRVKKNDPTWNDTLPVGTYYFVSISGNCDIIPTRLKRKQAAPRTQPKDVLSTGIRLEKLGVGDYYGFEIDGDRLFLLGDFTVTHNTYIATALAAINFINQQYDRIILVRPAVEAGEKLGFLPGDLNEKIDPYMRPIFDALYAYIPPNRVKSLMEYQQIEVAPLAYMRGRTLDHAFIILDEAQNTTISQMKMFLTRIGKDSKVVITGDISQTDLPKHMRSGLEDAVSRLHDIPGIEICRLGVEDIVRHDLVQKIVEAYDDVKE